MIFLRNKFYDYGIFRSYEVSRPVISIGNLTTGGTGKTPLTIFIAGYFLRKGKSVGIVSRGYKRKSQDIVIVSDGQSINEDIDQSGDELILISGELMKNHKGKFFAAAGTDRIEAVNLIIRKFSPDIIILDDAFQHRRIKRDLDIVVIDSSDFRDKTFFHDLTIPSGCLREGRANLKRADLVIQNNKEGQNEITPATGIYGKEVLSMRYKTEYFIDNKNSILPNADLSAFVFSGIAGDRSFMEMIRQSGFSIAGTSKFPDHHNYTDSDIEGLKKKYEKGMIYITTEKDFVKIRKYNDFVSNYPVYFLKLKIELNDDKGLFKNKLDEITK